MRRIFSSVLMTGILLSLGCVSQTEFDACRKDTEKWTNAYKKARSEQLEQVKILAEAGLQLQMKGEELKSQLKETQNTLAEVQQESQAIKAKLEDTIKALFGSEKMTKELQGRLRKSNEQLVDSQQTIVRLEAAVRDAKSNTNGPDTQNTEQKSTLKIE